MASKLFAVFFVIVVFKAYFISCDDQEPLLDAIAKQVAGDIADKISSAIDDFSANVITITGKATVDVVDDLRLDGRLNKAGKIIEEIKAHFEEMKNVHDAHLKALRDQIAGDTASYGGAENPFVQKLISMVTVLDEHMLQLVFGVRDYVGDQIKLMAEDLENHVSGDVIAEKLKNNLNIHHEVVLKTIVSLNLELIDKFQVAIYELGNGGASSHTLDYIDEKIRGVVYHFIDAYVKARGQVTKDIETFEAKMLYLQGHQ